MSISKKQFLSSLFIMILFGSNILVADNTLVLQLTHAPAEIRQAVEKEFEAKRDPAIFGTSIDNKTTAEFNETLIKNNIRSLLKPKLSGFTCIYGGYTDFSDHHGIVKFPLRHAGDKVYVAITESIEPSRFEGNTISNCVFKAETKRYLFTKKAYQNKKPGTAATPPPASTTPATPAPAGTPPAAPTPDQPAQKDQDITYWEITEAPVQAGDVIDRDTIVILTNINNIAVRQEPFLATKTVQFVLPFAFYVIGNTNNEECILRGLDYKNFFERIGTEEKTTNNIKQQRITNL